MAGQLAFTPENDYQELDRFFIQNRASRIFLVGGKALQTSKLGRYFERLTDRLGIEVVRFRGYEPRPEYSSVCEAVSLFRERRCDAIAAVGGGSAIDVAKCVKLFSNLSPERDYREQEIDPDPIPFLAAPGTVSSGSEANHTAVYYIGRRKHNTLIHDGCIPDAVLFDCDLLRSLPIAHKKAGVLHILGSAMESYWSTESTEESKTYARRAIQTALEHMEAFLRNEQAAIQDIFTAANMAGKAVNITRTTAAHLMSYGLSDLFGVSHGRAVALCANRLFPYMASHTERCADPRGRAYVDEMFLELAAVLGCHDVESASEKLDGLLAAMNFAPVRATEADRKGLYDALAPYGFAHNPIRLTRDDVYPLYMPFLRER